MGTVLPYETAQGKRYRVAFRKPDHSQSTKRGFKTKKEATLFLATVEVSKASGDWIDASDARATVGTLGVVWLAAQSHLKPSSLRPVEIAWRLHVLPSWGAVQVGEARNSDVQAWVTAMSAKRGATTVLRAYGVLAGILDGAVKDRRIRANPARGINLPRKVPKSHAYLSHLQVKALAEESGANGALVLMLAYTGLRWGEATGLRVRHLNMLKRRAQVEENAVLVGRVVHVGTPKTYAFRSVPYPKALSLPLAGACEGKGRDSILFGPGRDYMKLPHNQHGWFANAVARCMKDDPDFPRVTPHDLRHTAASLAVSAGANVKAVQRMLGHASAAMTLDVYADLFDDDLDAVAERMDQAISASTVVKPLSNQASLALTPA
ncbi:site-specific integrase [Cryobacterium melibiosiphilum]|uniref:Site-specific integrase n=1 Tax=Cryobacterium melibiosiphilum TaxID=995039 RepID=A0A3A5MUZ8_9MICO|nr:site-specific integrase [Cryobacterium melibiosiphilum]RJT89826.1 site-specific integrase [Cryobacterium melibiosiphilum]